MIASLFLAFAALRHQEQTPTAASLVTRMFDRYYNAKTLGGTIRTTQSASGVTVITETNLAYERPAKLRLEQRQRMSDAMREKMIVSDGMTFYYTAPPRLITSTPFLHESIRSPGHDDQTISDLYAVIAADLPDRSPMLDVFVARLDDLKYFKNQLAKIQLVAKENVNGRSIYTIEGDWREIESVLAVGHYKMKVTENGDLIQYVLTQDFAAPAGVGKPGGDPIAVTTTWDASITVGASIKAETFAFRP